MARDVTHSEPQMNPRSANTAILRILWFCNLPLCWGRDPDDGTQTMEPEMEQNKGYALCAAFVVSLLSPGLPGSAIAAARCSTWTAGAASTSTAASAAATPTALSAGACAWTRTCSGRSDGHWSTVDTIEVWLVVAFEVVAAFGFVEIISTFDGDGAGIRGWLTLDGGVVAVIMRTRRGSSATLKIGGDTGFR